MEIAENLNIFCASFFDKTKIFNYFSEFRDTLQETQDAMEFQKTETFLNCLILLDKCNANQMDLKCSLTGSDNFPEELNSIKLSILEVFCLNFPKILIETQYDPDKFHNVRAMLDTIVYLLQMSILKVRNKGYIDALLENVCSYFSEVTRSMKHIHSNMIESESKPVCYLILKFVAKILRTIPCENYNCYVSNINILTLIEVLPFPDITAVKLFVNFIIPALFQFSPKVLKEQILKSMWDVVCSQFDESNLVELSETHSCIYIMIYCISHCIYNHNNEIENFYIHNEITFWNIILSGLTSNLPFTRKKALNIFKMILLWTNRIECEVLKNSNAIAVPILLVKWDEDMKIWNDIVTVFESLEEKQIHVIKPVLPKFARILSLATKKYSALNDNDSKLASAWVMAVISRMLKHETKFVVRWALSTVLSLDFKTYPLHEDNSELLITILLETFNDQNLYSRNNEQDNFSLFLSSEKISEFLKNYFFALESHSKKVLFLRGLLRNIASQSWCIVALLHVTVALSRLEIIPSWNLSDISHIRKIVMDCQRSHEHAFRSSLEYFMLECCTLFLDWNSLECEDLAELLIIFKSSAVTRHSEPWNKFASRLSDLLSSDSFTSITKESAIAYCTTCIARVLDVSMTDIADIDIEEVEFHKVARMLIMFADSSVISAEHTGTNVNWVSLLEPVFSTLQCASRRPYMNNKKFFSAVKLITLLIIESQGCGKLKTDTPHKHLFEENHCYNQVKLDSHVSSIVQGFYRFPGIVEFIYQKLFMDVDSNGYTFQNNILFEIFHVLIAECRLRDLFLNITSEIVKKVRGLLDDVQNRRNLLFPLWKLLVNLTENGLNDNSSVSSIRSVNYSVLSKVLNDGILRECLSKPTCLNGIGKEQWLQLSYQSICDFWNVTCRTTAYLSNDEVANLMIPLAEEAQNVLSDGPKMAVPYAISTLKHIIPKLGKQYLNLMSELLEASWKACLELRGNEAFRPALSSLIETIFQTGMLHEVFFPTLEKYINLFKELSVNTCGVFYALIKQFCLSIPLQDLIKSQFDSIQLFVHALTFGPIHQKAQKIMEETLIYLIQLDSNLSKSLTLLDSNKPSCYVRIAVLKYLLENLKENTHETEVFVFTLIVELMKADCNDTGKSTSHFANSMSHRVRNRAWQSILILQPCIKDKSFQEELLLRSLNALGTESQQPSIRYLQEWTVFNILHGEQILINKFISNFEESLDKRPSYIISVISIANLLILQQMIAESNILICFKLLTILCMAQNFTVRLYAQVTITNLFFLCQRINMDNAIRQYGFVSQMVEMQTSLDGHGNFFKNVKKLSNDFYFSSFSPINHFTLETILYELPRLSNLSPDEWIRPEWFGEKLFLLQIYNTDDHLKKSSPTSWSSKTVSETSVTDDSLDYNFQKKITPVKDLMEDGENLDLTNLNGKGSRKDGLIVVASLIDRIPNLGGLCRTCEVFGVTEFVIGSFRYTEDKQFQNLSVSADKWVSIKEVKPYVLKEYLTSMKEQGYVLIGAEQTEDSCNLKEYKFPKKSVLLLGHEKEGLPVDLIQLLDICVEIPQQGVVRSLNVHVSGAILIWEYARQHNSS